MQDCDICGERYDDESASSYLRQVDFVVVGGTFHGEAQVDVICKDHVHESERRRHSEDQDESDGDEDGPYGDLR